MASTALATGTQQVRAVVPVDGPWQPWKSGPDASLITIPVCPPTGNLPEVRGMGWAEEDCPGNSAALYSDARSADDVPGILLRFPIPNLTRLAQCRLRLRIPNTSNARGLAHYDLYLGSLDKPTRTKGDRSFEINQSSYRGKWLEFTDQLIVPSAGITTITLQLRATTKSPTMLGVDAAQLACTT
ncbi:hypothetical protein ADK67_27685 [Saccharothrix sp. NRRL B-16348]|nr:hypothetical protein ADK67_27685 [Saccharothrix sp. NRRL B-16348]